MNAVDIAIVAVFVVGFGGIGFVLNRRREAERATAFAGDPDFDDVAATDAENDLVLRKRTARHPTMAFATGSSARPTGVDVKGFTVGSQGAHWHVHVRVDATGGATLRVTSRKNKLEAIATDAVDVEAAFDRDLAAAGSDTDRVRALLTDDVKAALRELFVRDGVGFCADENGVWARVPRDFSVPGTPLYDPALIRRIVRKVEAIVAAMQAAPPAQTSSSSSSSGAPLAVR